MTEEQGSATRDEEEKDQPQDASSSPESEGDDQASGGADSAADKEAKGSEDSDSDSDSDEAVEGEEEAKQEVRQLEEEGPPEKLEDWPTGKAKYETFGGPEGEHAYNEGPEQQLGPSDTRHREDGSVEVEGEEADDPDELKGEPIPGGPTDPDTPNLRMDKASPEDSSQNEEDSSEDDEDDSSDEDESAGDGEE